MEANKIATFSKTEEIRGAVFTEILCLHLSISAFSIIIVNRMILTPPSPLPPLLPLTVYFMKALLCWPLLSKFCPNSQPSFFFG